MGCLFDCFRAAGGEPRGGRARAQLVSSSVIPAAVHPKVGERRATPSRNALSAVFLREDEGSQATSSGTNQDAAERNRVDRELTHEDTFLKNGGALFETPNEIRKAPENTDSVYQRATHSARQPALSENLNSMHVLKNEDCQNTPETHQSSCLPDAMSSSWKGCDASNPHESESLRKTEESNGVNNESVVGSELKLPTLDSCSFTSNNDDTSLDGSKSSPFSAPSKLNAEMHTPAINAHNLEGLRNENSSQLLSESLNPVGDFQNCEVLSEDFFDLKISDKDLKDAKNGSLVSIQLSMSDECSLFQNSEGSVSSCNKTIFEEKSQTNELTIHTSRKNAITDSGSDIEFPTLSQWLKPPNSRTSGSAKSSDDDRPIIGMVAAHWKEEEPENFTPQWWDGNGIPNSTNKYKEDQKVSWHAMSFEERLEKALSEEKLLSQRKCSTGNTSQFSGVEGEESDTAASNHLRVAAFT